MRERFVPEPSVTIPFGTCGIDQLTLNTFLGEGGFGSAWVATDPATSARYCLKLIQMGHYGDEDLQRLEARVRNEASVRIPSPYVVDAIGYQTYGRGEFAVIFDLFEEAQSLGGWIRDHVETATGERKSEILRQALQGIAVAHDVNIVHRDIKPANILVNNRDEVRIIDFGIGKFKHGIDGPSMVVTRKGDVMGTPHYMAPELWKDASTADCRCDIYAYGHVFFEMIFGQNLCFSHGWITNTGEFDYREFLMYIKNNPYPAIVDQVPVSPEIREVFYRTLAFERDQRYPSGEAMLKDCFGETLELDEPPTVLQQRLSPDHARFVVLEGPTRGVMIPVTLRDGEATTMGRRHIDRDNQFMSRNHAGVERQGDRFFLSDLGSLNGTIYHGRNLAQGEKVELQHGDHVRLADTFLEFSLSAG